MINKETLKIEDIKNIESIIEKSIKKIVPKITVNFSINSESLYFNEKAQQISEKQFNDIMYDIANKQKWYGVPKVWKPTQAEPWQFFVAQFIMR
tara:strand:- start:246 stop:527 length:282 start_codon:yes stop_codon:yes gene_type:complete